VAKRFEIKIFIKLFAVAASALINFKIYARKWSKINFAQGQLYEAKGNESICGLCVAFYRNFNKGHYFSMATGLKN
jgi:hypothetical protein